MLELHDFDIKLCRYLGDNLDSFFADPRRAELLSAVDSRVVDFLKFEASAVDGFAQPTILLGGDEFSLLKCYCETPLRLTGTWTGWPGLHSRHLRCRPEIAEGISEREARHWCKRSAEFAEQLESPRTTIREGVEAIEGWVGEIRTYLAALGLAELLPCPEGAVPTPMHQQREGLATAAEGGLPYLDLMRSAVKALGVDRPADELVKHAGVQDGRGRKALRELEARGEYKGFKRAVPQRYIKKPGSN